VFVIQYPETQAVLSLNAGAVRPHVDPAALRITRNDQVGSADVAPAVQLVPLRRREQLKIDFIPLDDVFHYRTGFNFDRRQIFKLTALFLPCS
jgi:hypothetical protein